MRFSPYAMEDYGLQHRNGAVLPFNPGIEKGLAHQEAFWNIYWAATPKIDRFLDLKYEDFDGFRLMCESHPFRNVAIVNTLLINNPDLIGVFSTDTPAGCAAYFSRHQAPIHATVAHEYGYLEDLAQMLPDMSARLDMAQSLVDVRDAAVLCQSVVSVDFKARRRL